MRMEPCRCRRDGRVDDAAIVALLGILGGILIFWDMELRQTAPVTRLVDCVLDVLCSGVEDGVLENCLS